MRIFLTLIWLLVCYSLFGQERISRVLLTNENTIYVGPQGNNATGARGRADQPFAAISNALASAQNGDIVIVRPGNYTNAPVKIGATDGADMTVAAKSPLQLVRKTNVVVRFESGAKVWSGGTAVGEYLTIENSAHITVNGLWIEGTREPETQSTNGYAVVLGRGTNINVVFDGPTIRNISAQGIVFNMWDGYSSNVVVRHGYFYNIGSTNCDFDADGAANNSPDGAAVAGRGGANWSVHDNTFEFCLRAVEFDPNLGHHQIDSDIVNNRMIRCREYPLLFTGYSSSPTLRIARLRVQNNTITHSGAADFETPNGSAAIAAFLLQDSLIQNNDVSGFSFGIDAWHQNANAVHPNTNNVVSGNRIYNSASAGIRVFDHPSHSGTVDGWLISGNYVGPCVNAGIDVTCNNSTIIGNKIFNCPSPVAGGEWGAIMVRPLGGFIAPCTNMVIAYNDIWGSQAIEHGIRVNDGAVNTKIYGNNIRSNSLSAIRIATAGNVPFLQHEANGFWGIGTNAPAATLHAVNPSSTNVFAVNASGVNTPATPGSILHWCPFVLNGTNGFLPFYR